MPHTSMASSITSRCYPRVVTASFQPLFTPPTTFAFGQRALVLGGGVEVATLLGGQVEAELLNE